MKNPTQTQTPKINKTLSRFLSVVSSIAEKQIGNPADICHPLYYEIVNGKIDRTRYASEYCADVSADVLDKINEIINSIIPEIQR